MTSVKQAALLVIASSILVPVVGVATAPILAHSLGPDGRGIAAAAAAPFLVASSVGTLGMPQAVTFYIAQGRRFNLLAAGVVLALTIMAGLIGTAVIGVSRGYLSGGVAGVAELILIGGVLVAPALVVTLLRGVATGLQMWRAVALERALSTLVKAIALIALAILGKLDVLSAVLVLCLSPIFGGICYFRLLGRPHLYISAGDSADLSPAVVARYGASVWLGSVALMLMARVNELFVLPLSNAQQLGLLVVAVTISDIPWIVTQALRDVLFGTSSAKLDPVLLGRASRIATTGAALLGIIVGFTLPLWLTLVFGRGFAGALWPTVILLASATAAVPGLVAGAALEASGRPKVRSIILVAGLALNVGLVFVLVAPLGAVGASMAVLITSASTSAITIAMAASSLGVKFGLFTAIGRSDLRDLLGTATDLVRRMLNLATRGERVEGKGLSG